MHAKSAVFCIVLLHVLYRCDSLDGEPNKTLAECESFCKTAGGTTVFDPNTKQCKCLFPKKPHAKTKSGKKFKAAIENQSESVTTVATTPVQAETVMSEEITSTEPATDSSSEILRQQPARRLHRLTPQRRQREPRPITPEQQHLILQQIRDHLNRLGQITDHRIRQIEIDAIGNNLRQLAQTVVIQTPSTRSRMRHVADEARRRQQRQRPSSRLVGATLNATLSQENEMESAVKEIFHGKKTVSL